MTIEHGTFTLSLMPNNIVLVDAKGPWNIEAVEHYHHDISEIVASFNGAPWRHIAILRSETLFMPDVVARLEQHFLWRKKHNVLSDTTILSNSFSENISKQQIHHMFEKLDMPHFFASDLDAALKQISELNEL